jgi:Cysteine-rich secretory protein family
MVRFMIGLPLTISLLLAAGTAPVTASASSGGRYFPLTPARILDTRIGVGSPIGPLQGGSTLNLTVTGRGGVPASGATAVVLNVTVTGPAAPAHLTVWPTGGSVPLASNLNFNAGQTVANLVVVGLGTGGQVSIYASTTLHVIADAEGWVNDIPTGPDGRFNPLVPARLLDTRIGFGGSTTLGTGTVSVGVFGRAGVPASGVSAVVLNVTVTNPTAYGFITAWPHGLTRPLASNLNFSPGQTIANRVMVGIGPGGLVDFSNSFGSVDLIVDISGWFTDASGSSGATYFSVTPTRIIDTRQTANPFQSGGVRAVQIGGRGGVPAMGGAGAPTAVVANVTVTNTSAASYLTVWPESSGLPMASDLNWTASLTVPNLVVVALGPSGAIDIFNNFGGTDVIVDVVGYYVGTPLPPPPTGSTMANLINQDRSAAGVAPLQWSGCLASIANGESVRQAHQGYISHAGGVYLDLGCGYSSAGENVGYTSAGINDNQLNGLFMNSPGHKANILNPNFHFVGTAWVVASNGYGYISEEFAG